MIISEKEREEVKYLVPSKMPREIRSEPEVAAKLHELE